MTDEPDHAFAVSLIFEVAGGAHVADYCRDNDIGLAPVCFTHPDIVGQLVALGEEVFTIVPLAPAALQQLRFL